MHLKTDVEGFEKAFFKVVQNRDDTFYNPLRSYAIGEDCWGRVYSKSFSIHKHRGENKPMRLDGEIIEEENGLLLELYLRTDYDNIRTGIKVFVFAILLAYGIGSLPFILPWMEDCFLVWAIIMAMLLFPLVFKLARWITNAAVNGLQYDFMEVLKEIEKQIVSDKKYST